MRAKLTTLNDLIKAKQVQVKPYQRKGKFVIGYSRLDPRMGDRVRVSEGSGLDSGKTGVIVSQSEVKTRGDLVPTNIEGAYKPVDWKKEVAVRLDNGELITMFKNRLLMLVDVGYSQPMKYEKVHGGGYHPVGFEKPSKTAPSGKTGSDRIWGEFPSYQAAKKVIGGVRRATGKEYFLRAGLVRRLKPGTDIDEYKAKHPDAKRIGKPPSIKTMQKWSFDGIAKATDGCKVEPDGTCQHGHDSWLKVLGYI